MEDLNNNICPTEILIDIKDDNEFLSSNINSKKTNGSLESKAHLNNKDTTSDIKHESYQSLLDMSPSRINEINEFKSNMTLNTDVIQSVKLNGGVSDDCPTAILVDVPSSSSFSMKEYCRQEDKLSEYKITVPENHELTEKVYACSDTKNCNEMEDSYHSPNLNDMKNEMSVKRLRWKTPSPESMSRISKEASKIIHNLNSSAIFDDDSLLTEEILPIPINFDNFDLDDDNIDQEDLSGTDNTCKHEISNHKLLTNVQTQNAIISTEIIEKEGNDYPSIPENSILSKKNQDIPVQLPLEKEITMVSLESFNELNSNSEELCSSEINSDSLDNLNFSTVYDGADDVFGHVSSEDKENIKEKENRVILTKEMKSSKTTCKNLLMSRTKLEHRGTLRNLSNIKYEATVSAKCLSGAGNKKVNIPLKKKSLSAKLKETQPLTGKPQIKDVTSVKSQNTSKIILRSNTSQSTKELISSLEKSCSVMRDASFLSNTVCKSLSSDLKQNVFKTPSKRYSICTPLKSASAAKPPLTPALPNFQSPAIPRYTPRSARGSHFSFSSSWQQSTDASHFSSAKGLKQQNSTFTTISSNTSKLSFGKINSSKQGKQSFSQSMSAISFQSLRKDAMSTSSKSRFSSKLSLPSPLSVTQDKKLARALFPSVPRK